MSVRIVILIAVVAACGGDSRSAPAFPEPSSNPFDVSGGRGAAPATSGRRATPRPVNRTFRGAYLRATDTNAFKPCGTLEYLPIMGTPQVLFNLRRNFLYYLPSMGRPMLGVFRGRLQTDTLQHVASDSGSTPVVQRHFFLVAVDTLRVWQGNECARSRLPPE